MIQIIFHFRPHQFFSEKNLKFQLYRLVHVSFTEISNINFLETPSKFVHVSLKTGLGFHFLHEVYNLI